MKNVSYQQVIHNLMWITFLNFFKKSLAFYTFMCYNIEKLRNNILKEDTYYVKRNRKKFKPIRS